MEEIIYLDNASTTMPSAAAKQAAQAAMEAFGNPSSMHRLGLAAEKLLKKSREQVAGALGVETGKIYFTSGGTEANNMAIFGAVSRRRGGHIITTQIEHPSVLAPIRALENDGFSVTYLPPGRDGRIRSADFAAALRPDTVLASVMHVNNEVGTVQPVAELKRILREKAPRALFHVDAVQGFGKAELKPRQWGIDLLSVSAHKIHGLKGTGALYVAGGKINPLLVGGGQERDLRSGTENVVGIAAFGAAAGELCQGREDPGNMRQMLAEWLLDMVPDIQINGGEGCQSGYVLNVSFRGIKAEILLHMLEDCGIYVSTGSACSTNKPMPSPVLTAMGCTPTEIAGAVRFSFSGGETAEMMEKTARVTAQKVAEIRKYMR